MVPLAACQVCAQKKTTHAESPRLGLTAARTRQALRPDHVAGVVRARIKRGGERLGRFEDFRDQPFLSFMAVAQALSRMARAGEIERLSKGSYYHSRETTFGRSRPNPAAIRQLASRRKSLFPAGIAAANLLGFTTQAARFGELATSASSLPRKLIGKDTVVHARRPEAWAKLSETDAALLDFLRRAGRTSELSPDATVRRTLVLLSERGRYQRLASVANTEPPRVRALLGPLGEQLRTRGTTLEQLRESLHPLSRYEFGSFGGLSHARAWQAKKHGR